MAQSPLYDSILNALRQVDDPDLKRDIVSLNMVQDLKVEGTKVTFRLVLTTPACPLKDVIKNACITAIHHMVDPGLEVDITLDSMVTTQARAGQDALRGVKNIIAVASGKGGVGKSTVATNLAIALAQSGASVGLVDADIYGPSLPTMLGLRNTRPDVKEDKAGKLTIIPMEAHGIKAMSVGLLIDERQALVWRGPMITTAMKQLMLDVAWGELDYLVIDMPPGTGDIYLTLAQQFPLTGVVIVTTPARVSTADTRKSLEMFKMPAINIPVLGIVENMSWFTPLEHPESKYYLHGKGGGQELADTYCVPLLGHLPMYASLAEEADLGRPAVTLNDANLRQPFMDLAQKVAQQVSMVNAQRGVAS